MKIVNPFRIDIDPLRLILLVNFGNDPDTMYKGFEPQYFDDEVNGTGHLIIGWRNDGRVDVYHQAGVRPQAEKYSIAGGGLANMCRVEMPVANFSVNDAGVQAEYRFTDLQNRVVELKVVETCRAARRPFGLLAPMGDATENPPALPMVLIDDFYFVRRKGSEVLVIIDGKNHRADNFPLPLDGRRMSFARYGTEITVATVNPRFDGSLEAASVVAGVNRTESGNLLEIAIVKGNPAIVSVTGEAGSKSVVMTFNPPFPCVTTMLHGEEVAGTFIVKGYESTGEVTGTWNAERDDETILIQMTPSGGWKPKPARLMLRLLYRIVPIFRRWPKTYMWNACLYDQRGGVEMKSGWIRLNKRVRGGGV